MVLLCGPFLAEEVAGFCVEELGSSQALGFCHFVQTDVRAVVHSSVRDAFDNLKLLPNFYDSEILHL